MHTFVFGISQSVIRCIKGNYLYYSVGYMMCSPMLKCYVYNTTTSATSGHVRTSKRRLGNLKLSGRLDFLRIHLHLWFPHGN